MLLRTGKPAFRSLEDILLKDGGALRAIANRLAEWTDPLSIFPWLDPSMDIHGGKAMIIDHVTLYHFDIPLYTLNGNKYVWPEVALCDPQLDLNAEVNSSYSLASRTYTAFNRDGRLSIEDIDGNCYLLSAQRDAESAAIEANQIASLRSLIAFEHIYCFDGVFGNPKECDDL